ncbi:MAG: hypothetical protein Q8L27_04240 [archaeon]|nr:hypothetical protein [archaeon]
MAFKRKKNFGIEIIETTIIDNSDTIYMGQPVKTRNGNIEIIAAGDAMSGVVVDIVDKNGNSIFGSLAVKGLATVSGSPDSGYVTVGATNETVDLIAAKIDMSPFTIYSASVTGTMNTTNASNKKGGWVDGVVASSQVSINETTNTLTVGTAGQFKNWGVDPDDSSRMLVSIAESEFFTAAIALA